MQATKGFWVVLCLAFSQPLFALTLQERVAAAWDTANSEPPHDANACSASAEYPLRNPGFYWESVTSMARSLAPPEQWGRTLSGGRSGAFPACTSRLHPSGCMQLISPSDTARPL